MKGISHRPEIYFFLSPLGPGYYLGTLGVQNIETGKGWIILILSNMTVISLWLVND